MNRISVLVCVLLFSVLINCNTQQKSSTESSSSKKHEIQRVEKIFDSLDVSVHASGVQEAISSVNDIQTKAKVYAIVRAYYPEHIQSVVREGKNIVFNVHGTKIYYLDGRMLHELLDDENIRVRSIIYPYRIENIKDIFQEIPRGTDNFSSTYIRRSDFQIALLGDNIKEIQNSIREYRILGFRVRLHPMAAAQAVKASAQILEMARSDIELSTFLKGIKTVSGHYQRNVRNSSNISMHTFGLALDIIPYSYNSKASYWLWTKQNYPETWNSMGLDARWLLPQKIVEAFESHGFIWGGKWPHYDTMHLEYRPELIEYAKIRKELEQVDS